jgi:hypothetical protein
MEKFDGQINLRIRLPRRYRLSLTPPDYLSTVYRRRVWAYDICGECRKPSQKCRCSMKRERIGKKVQS